jgi:hypothetical protein
MDGRGMGRLFFDWGFLRLASRFVTAMMCMHCISVGAKTGEGDEVAADLCTNRVESRSRQSPEGAN